METWRVWECSHCGSTMKLNYDASVQDYERIKHCVCDEGLMVWQHNYSEESNLQTA